MKRNFCCLVLNALMILVICGILLGAFDLQIFHGEQPCPFCLLQRLAMIGVATGALMNLRFGIRSNHYAVSLLSLLFGASVALWMTAMHVSPAFPAASSPIMGLHLYVWSLLIFGACLFTIAIMMLLYDKKSEEIILKKNGLLFTVPFAILFFTTVGSVIATFVQCRFGGC
jgi:disulfide bond formation protein DsbB